MHSIQAPEIHSWEIWIHKAPCSSLKIHLRESKRKKNLGAEAVHLLYIHVSSDSSKNLIHIRHGQWSCVSSNIQHRAYKKVRLLEHVRSLNLVGQRGTTCNASSVTEKFINWKKTFTKLEKAAWICMSWECYTTCIRHFWFSTFSPKPNCVYWTWRLSFP